jgi:ribosomal protein S6
LAYKIKHQEQAYYLLYYLEAEIDNLNKFKKMSAINKDIMRTFILKHDKK